MKVVVLDGHNGHDGQNGRVTLDEYTPDAICRAMGLPGFVEAVWATQREPVMRVLLKPSFHPEVCITLIRGRLWRAW